MKHEAHIEQQTCGELNEYINHTVVLDRQIMCKLLYDRERMMSDEVYAKARPLATEGSDHEQ